MTAALLALAAIFGAAAATYRYRCRMLRKRLDGMNDVLLDIERGFPRHKLLTAPGEDTAELCFSLNRIMEHYNSRISALELREREYKQLLTNLSHDLRTPLASLTGYLEAVCEHYVPESRHMEYVGVARRKADELRDRVDALFSWFQLDAGDMAFHFAPEDLYELTRTAAADFIPLVEKAGMRCVAAIPEEELTLSLDSRAIGRMLGNLLQNALLHSGGDTVEIRAGRREKDAWVSVRDNGEGIGERDVPHIFDRLYKCDPARTAKSSGLGLSITKMLAEAHGGTVEVITRKGAGSMFTLRFPLQSR